MCDLPIVKFAPQFRRMVLEGFKVTTIRYQCDLAAGAIWVKFDDDEQLFPATILWKKQKFLTDLDDTDARADGFADHQELISTLQAFYPDLPANPELSIIRFRLAEHSES